METEQNTVEPERKLQLWPRESLPSGSSFHHELALLIGYCSKSLPSWSLSDRRWNQATWLCSNQRTDSTHCSLLSRFSPLERIWPSLGSNCIELNHCRHSRPVTSFFPCLMNNLCCHFKLALLLRLWCWWNGQVVGRLPNKYIARVQTSVLENQSFCDYKPAGY
jgi:hypothetical protein